jgi:cobalt/nickel transport system permease protein
MLVGGWLFAVMILAAFVFAAQMLNFPVFGGTSAHLVGGALLGVVLGRLGLGPLWGFALVGIVGAV